MPQPEGHMRLLLSPQPAPRQVPAVRRVVSAVLGHIQEGRAHLWELLEPPQGKMQYVLQGGPCTGGQGFAVIMFHRLSGKLLNIVFCMISLPQKLHIF